MSYHSIQIQVPVARDGGRSQTFEMKPEGPSDAPRHIKMENESPRIINGKEIVFGLRSECDMKSWSCGRCGMYNRAIRMLIFDIAPLKCLRCGLPNPNDFNISLANVRVNGVCLIDEVKSQQLGENECVSYAICHLIQEMNSLNEAISSEKPNFQKAKCTISPQELIIPHNELFPPGNSGGGFHKILHMLQRVTNGIGVPLKFKTAEQEWVEHHFKGAEIIMIHCDDFEEICRQIADGNTLLAPLHVGKQYGKLQYCQYYTAVPSIQIHDLKVRNIKVPGHVLLLVGALCIKQFKAYYALEQAGDLFCRQVGSGIWKYLLQLFHEHTVGGGIGKLSASSDFCSNFFMVSRQGDDAQPKFYGIADESDVGLLDTRFVPEEKGSLKMNYYNSFLIRHGKYFIDRFTAFGIPRIKESS